MGRYIPGHKLSKLQYLVFVTVLEGALYKDVFTSGASIEAVSDLRIGDDRTARDVIRKAIIAFDKADENEQLAESFRELEESLTTG